MKIKMLETRQGSPDGVSVETYQEGKTYNIPEDLAKVFLKEKWAERPAQTKNQGGPPENKKNGKGGKK